MNIQVGENWNTAGVHVFINTSGEPAEVAICISLGEDGEEYFESAGYFSIEYSKMIRDALDRAISMAEQLTDRTEAASEV